MLDSPLQGESVSAKRQLKPNGDKVEVFRQRWKEGYSSKDKNNQKSYWQSKDQRKSCNREKRSSHRLSVVV